MGKGGAVCQLSRLSKKDMAQLQNVMMIIITNLEVHCVEFTSTFSHLEDALIQILLGQGTVKCLVPLSIWFMIGEEKN